MGSFSRLFFSCLCSAICVAVPVLILSSEICGQDAADHCKKGKEYEEQQNLLEAIREYQEALQDDPKNVPALHGLGRCCLAVGDYDSAFRALRRAVELDPKNADNGKCFNLMGLCLSRSGRYNESVDYFKKAIETDPKLLEAYKNLYTVLTAGVGDHEEALKWMKRALEVSPDDYEVLTEIATHYKNRGYPALAVEWAKKVIDISNKRAIKAWYAHTCCVIIASIYRQQGRYNEAIPFYKEAIRIFHLAGENAKDWVNEPGQISRFLCRAYIALGDFQKALDTLNESIEILKNPSHPVYDWYLKACPYFYTHEVFEQTTDPQVKRKCIESVRSLLEAGTMPPNYIRDVAATLVFFYRDIGEYDKALEFMKYKPLLAYQLGTPQYTDEEIAQQIEAGIRRASAQLSRKGVTTRVALTAEGGASRLSELVTASLACTLSDVKQVVVLERSRVDKLFEEARLREAGYTRIEDRANVGVISGADVIVTLNLAAGESSALNVNGCVLEVSQKKVATVPAISVPEKEIATAGEMLLPGVLKALGIEGGQAKEGRVTAEPESEITIAVPSFQNLSGDASKDFLGQTVSDLLSVILSKAEKTRIVDRSQMAAVKKEIELDMLGYTSGEAAKQFGKILGADFFVFGHFCVAGDQLMLISRVVESSNGELVANCQNTGLLVNLSEVIESHSKSISEKLKRKMTSSRETNSNSLLAKTESLIYGTEGRRLCYEGRYSEAKKLLEKAALLSPHDVEIQLDLALCYGRGNLQEKTKALEICETIASARPEATRPQWNQFDIAAKTLESTGNYSDALEWLQRMRFAPETIERNKTSWEAIERRVNTALAELAFKSGNPTLAEDLSRQACNRRIFLTDHPFSTPYWLSRAEMMAKSGQIDQAMTLCRESADLYWDSVDSFLMMGDLLEKKKKNKEAMTVYENAVKVNPATWQAAEATHKYATLAAKEYRKDSPFDAWAKKIIALPDTAGNVGAKLGLSYYYSNRKQQESRKILASYGLSTSWEVLGPFQSGDMGDYLPPCPFKGTPRAEDGYTGKTPVKWLKVTGIETWGYVNFKRILGDLHWNSAYARTVLSSPKKQEVRLLVGSDDTIIIWVNDSIVLRTRPHRVAEADQDCVSVSLKQGDNVIVVRCEENHMFPWEAPDVDKRVGFVRFTERNWGFYLRVLSSEGKPIEGTSFR